MLKRFSVAVLLILLLCTSAFAMKNEPDGFRGIKWGDSVEQHKGEFENYTLLEDHIYKKYMKILSPDEFLDQLLTMKGIWGITYRFDDKGFFGGSYNIRDMETIEKELGEYLAIWGKEDELRETHDNEGNPMVVLLWSGEKVKAIFLISVDGARVEVSLTEGIERVNKLYEEQKATKDS